MTLKEALKRAECIEIDYSGMTEEWERGFNVGIKTGREAERISIRGYLESKTIEERKAEFVAIPYLGETREEKPDV